MNKAIKLGIVSTLVLCARIASAQCGLAPTGLVYLSINGTPLSGGSIGTYASGTTTPAVTYSDGTCTTALPNPVPLDSSGRPFPGSGGVSGIYLNTSLSYRLVLMDSSSVVQWTLDNITGSGGGSGGGGTNYWTLTGSAISNNNGSGTGTVSVGSDFTTNGNLFVVGGLELRDTQASPNYAIITAPACVGTLMGGVCTGANTTWKWPGFDMAGVLTSDGLGNLSWQPGGGGGGGAVGPTGALQLSNGAGLFTNNANLNFNAGTQTLVITSANASDAGLVITTGYAQTDIGFVAVNNASPTTPLTYNAFNAPTGGGAALSWTAGNYVETGSSAGPPTATTGESGFPHPGTVYCDTGTSPCVEKLWNGSAWISLATGGATSPGGSNCNIQINISGSFGGTNNLCWTTVGGNTFLQVTPTSVGQAGIDVTGGFAQADYGFYVSSGTNPSWNNINVPTGGLYAKSTYVLSYAGTGTSSGPPTPVTGQPAFSASSGLGTLYCDTGSVPCVEKLWNGSAWVNVAGTGGGVAGPNGSLQYNNTGTQAGSANLTFLSNILNLTGTLQIGGATSINSSNQFVGAAVNVAGTVQSQNTGTNITFSNSNSLFLVNGNGIVSDISENINGGTGQLSVTANTAANSITTVGGYRANAGGGSAAILSNGAGGTAVINSSSAFVGAGGVNVANTVTGTEVLASNTGAGITFSNTNANFQVNGNGIVSGLGFNSNGSTGQISNTNNTATNSITTIGGYRADATGGSTAVLTFGSGGTVLIDGSGNFVGPSVTTSGGITATGGFQSPSSSNSIIFVGSTGNFYNRTIGASTGLSCSGISSGWTAIASDNYVVVCNGGVRYRAALVSF